MNPQREVMQKYSFQNWKKLHPKNANPLPKPYSKVKRGTDEFRSSAAFIVKLKSKSDFIPFTKATTQIEKVLYSLKKGEIFKLI